MKQLARFLLLMLAVATAPGIAAAQTDGGVTIWTKGVPPGGITEKKDFGDHALSVSRREVDGRAEVHKTKADVFVIQSGAASLVTGGEMIAPTGGPIEFTGSGIKGGVGHDLGPGDVVEIPAGVPHQFLVPKGGQVTYFVVKVVKATAP